VHFVRSQRPTVQCRQNLLVACDALPQLSPENPPWVFAQSLLAGGCELDSLSLHRDRP